MPTTDALARLVRDSVLSGASAAQLFAAIDAAGFDVARALDVLARPFDHLPSEDAWQVEDLSHDPIYALVEHYGVQRASEIASRTENWSEVDVGRHHADIAAWLRTETAIANAAPIAEVYAGLGTPELSERRRSSLLHRIAGAYPLVELASVAPSMAEDDARVVGEHLQRDLSPLAAFGRLVGTVDDAVVVRAIERLWGIRRESPVDDDPDAVVVRYLAQLSRLEFRPLNAVLAFAAQRGEPDWWLPILRSCGLKGSQAALHLLETGSNAPAIAQHLARAGYDDHAVLTALLENGLGTRRSLALLRDGGWTLGRMVESLHHRGALLPEVRDHLDELRVPRAAQPPLVLPFWDAGVVDVVFDRRPPDRVLAGSTDGRGGSDLE